MPLLELCCKDSCPDPKWRQTLVHVVQLSTRYLKLFSSDRNPNPSEAEDFFFKTGKLKDTPAKSIKMYNKFYKDKKASIPFTCPLSDQKPVLSSSDWLLNSKFPGLLGAGPQPGEQGVRQNRECGWHAVYAQMQLPLPLQCGQAALHCC